ncbi:uncharacterized protein LOC144614945 isoform X2 [Panthera onca]
MSSSTQTVGYMRMETPAGLSHRCALVSGTSLACEGLSECAPETTSKAPVTIVPPPGVSSRGPARCGVPLPPGNRAFRGVWSYWNTLLSIEQAATL